jgi:hypothetical protein
MNKTFFGYSTGYVALTAVVGNTNQFTISIGSDADFSIQYLVAAVEQATVLVVTWSGLVQIYDSAAGKNFFDQTAGVPLDSVAGTGREPLPLPEPRLVKGNSSLTVTFVQRQAVATTVCLTLLGYKIV